MNLHVLISQLQQFSGTVYKLAWQRQEPFRKWSSKCEDSEAPCTSNNCRQAFRKSTHIPGYLCGEWIVFAYMRTDEGKSGPGPGDTAYEATEQTAK